MRPYRPHRCFLELHRVPTQPKVHYVAGACCVYRLFDADGALLYVGISNHFEYRMRSHSKTKFWWPNVDSIDVQWFGSRADAEAEESRAIWLERPAHNVQNPIPQRYRPRKGARAEALVSLADALPRLRAVSAIPNDCEQ